MIFYVLYEGVHRKAREREREPWREKRERESLQSEKKRTKSVSGLVWSFGIAAKLPNK
jgi:hypothetical protein